MPRTLAALALCALTVLVYSSSFHGDFVLDSKALVLDDPRVHAVSPGNIGQILRGPYLPASTDGPHYRPATTLSFLLNYAVLRNQRDPFGYHLVNTALHVGNVLLLYAVTLHLVRRSNPKSGTGAIWLSAGVSALWAIHPLATEAVTNIGGRANLLAAAGVLAALYAHVRGADGDEGRRQAWLFAAVAAGTLAIFAKESGIIVIPVIVLYDLLARSTRQPDRNVGQVVSGKLPWLLLIPAALLLYQRWTLAAVPPPAESMLENPLAGAGLLNGRLTALAVMGRYLWLAFWPATLSNDYSYAQIPLASGTPQEWAAWLTVACAGVAAALLLFKGHRLAFFAASFAFVTFLPGANLLFTAPAIMAEHYFYLPLAGMAACIALAVQAWRPKLMQATAPAVAVFLVLAIGISALAARTRARNEDWRDDVALWTSAVRAASNSFKTHLNLADALNQLGPERRDLARIAAETDRAIDILGSAPDVSRVVTVYRRAVGFHIELGDRLAKGPGADRAEAERMYRRAAALTERYVTILRGGAAAAGSQPATKDGDSTGVAEGYKRLAGIYLRLRDTEGTLDAARRARELAPFDAMGYRLAAVALTTVKRLDEAAVLLLTGFLVTGDGELRQASVDLYASDPGPKNCALKKGREGIILDSNCPLVREHMCAASAQAAAIQRDNGRAELAEELHGAALKSYGCQIR